MIDDAELLTRFAEHSDEAAFRDLVARYVDLVYAAALRQLNGDLYLAQDVAQSVFTDLARKARSLPRDASIAGWLYQAACFAAAKIVRGERRRQLREQEASAMQDSSAEDALVREQTCLAIDAAVGELNAADRNAVLLRFFQSKDLRTVGLALGISEDAAQKRVARALEKLRKKLTRRGMTLSVSALAAALAGNATHSAPAGLAASVATASLSQAPIATAELTANLFQTLTTTQSKLAIAALLAILVAPVALLWNQNASLRRQLSALRASSLSQRPTTNEPILINRDEEQRQRVEHLELLSLRGRVAQLTAELRKTKSPGAGLKPDSASNDKGADSILFSVELTNRLSNGQTLIAGGWGEKAMRSYLLATATIGPGANTPDERQVTLESRIIKAPEPFWEQIGWDASRSATRRSTVAGVLTPDQTNTLLKALKETEGANISNISRATGGDGEYLGVAFSRTDDKGSGTLDDREAGILMAIDIYPRISADGQSVDLEMRPSVVPTEVPIHSSLK